MKTISNFLIRSLVVIFAIAPVSCTKNTVVANNSEEINLMDSPEKDSSMTEKPSFFQLPELQKLADNSPNLKSESFGDENEEIRFIVGDIFILSFNKKIAYLNLLPKTSEDNNFYIHLVIQNLDSNVPIVVKNWTINNESGEVINLTDFYKNNKNIIKEIFDREGILFLHQKLSFKTYDHIKDTSIKNTYNNIGTDLQEINKVEIFSNNQKSIYLQRNSKNTLCLECDSLLIYKGDYLGEIASDEPSKKLLVLGFLEQIDHSPSALHIRLVSIN